MIVAEIGRTRHGGFAQPGVPLAFSGTGKTIYALMDRLKDLEDHIQRR